MFKELLADGERALVIANADEERVVRLAEPLRTTRSGPATRCCSTPAPATSTRRCPKSEVEELVLERSPTSTTSRSAA
jgi:proteasome-associated ATPase